MALNLHSKVASTKDAYGNDIEMQLPTPTTLLLESRETKQESPSPQPTEYTATLPLWKSMDINAVLESHLIEKQAGAFLKDQPANKRFTLELTIKEEAKK